MICDNNTRNKIESFAAFLTAEGWTAEGNYQFRKRIPTGGQYGYTVKTVKINMYGDLMLMNGWNQFEKLELVSKHNGDFAATLKAVIG